MIEKVTTAMAKVRPGPAALAFLAAVLSLWAYWPTLAEMQSRWHHDPQYSHGYLAVAFAVVLLWLRRSKLEPVHWQLDWRGFFLILAGLVLRLVAVAIYFDWLDAKSRLVSLA